MTFERPDLVGLAPTLCLVVLLALLSQWRRGVRLVDAYGGPEAALRLVGRRIERFPALRLIAGLLAVASLAGVAAGLTPEIPEEIPATPVDLLIAVDVSHSMTGTDVEPSRISWAQRLVEDLVEAGIADRVALSVFADWSYRLVPLTDDGDVVSFFAPWLVPDLVNTRDQGTSLSVLIDDAIEAWEERAQPDAIPIVLVISDGETHDGAEAVIASTRAAVDAGALIWTAGIGTTSGAPLTLTGSTAPLLDGSGSPVVAGYDEGMLRQIADAGRGAFHEIGDEAGVGTLLSDLRTLSGRTDTVVEQTRDPTIWLVLLGLVLLVLDALFDTGIAIRSRS
jgi:Ca-activated chloride channel family protein